MTDHDRKLIANAQTAMNATFAHLMRLAHSANDAELRRLGDEAWKQALHHCGQLGRFKRLAETFAPVTSSGWDKIDAD